MSEAAVAVEARPYHHGDLRRALIVAARDIVEREGPQALSLRAVARQAGVSPAAPYHHFKDKSELLVAVAGEGFHALGDALCEAAERDATDDALTAIGQAYVRFARANPALYRVMYDTARNEDSMPHKEHEQKDGGYGLVRDILEQRGVDVGDKTGLELACVAAWCSAHGLAEMVGFAQFKPLIAELGGEDAFVAGVLKHIHLFSGK